MWMGRILSPPPLLLHTETQKPSLQSALAVRHVGQRLRECGCCWTVVRLGFVGMCLLFEFAARTTGGLPEKWTGEKEWREEPEEVEEAAVLAGLPTLILLLPLLPEEEDDDEAVLVLMLLLAPSSSALLAGSSEDLQW